MQEPITNTGLEEAFFEAVAGQMQERQPVVNLLTFGNICSTDTEWLWYPFLPRGKIVLLTAAPGTGKTFLSLYLCAALSDGRPFFGQDESADRPPEKAVYQTAEDGLADTLKRRLEMLRPEPNYWNIFTIDESEKGLTLADVEAIEDTMRRVRPALMIFDPLQAYLGAEVDMHRANQVRPVLSRIGALAEKYNCTVLFIMHNSKMQQSNALYGPLGSVDIPAVSRSMLMLDKNPENEDQLILCHVKSSLAPHGASVLFHIERGNLVFDGFSELGAEEVYSASRATRNRKAESVEEVVVLLKDLLESHNGYAEIKEISRLQEEHNISKTTLYRAKAKLKLSSVKVGCLDKKTFWLLPEVDKEAFIKNRPADTFD